MKIHFLGTGTSCGVPVPGCQCEVCRSADPRDNRLRTSAVVSTSDARVLIDCGPDFREQMLRYARGNYFSGVLLTHEHYDHVGGLDDLRPFSYHHSMSVYADDMTVAHLKQRMPYCFGDHLYKGVPKIALHTVSPLQPFWIRRTRILPLRVMHGYMPILGYKINRKLAYITDMKTMPQETYEAIQGVKVLVINALRHHPHPTHQTVADAIRLSEQVGAAQTYLIHMCHEVGLHSVAEAGLPPTVHFAYDGLEVEF